MSEALDILLNKDIEKDILIESPSSHVDTDIDSGDDDRSGQVLY